MTEFQPGAQESAYDDDIAVLAGHTGDQSPRWVVGLTEEEMDELVALINDDPVDEQLLNRIKRRLRKKLKAIRSGLNPARRP